MFSRKAERGSISSRLVVLFTLASTLLLSCGLGVFYWLVVRHTFEEDNAVLADKLFALRTSLNRSGSIDALSAELNNPPPEAEPAYYIRLIDQNGRTIAQTQGMNTLLPPQVFPSPQNARPPESVRDYRRGAQLFSLVSTTSRIGTGRVVVQLAQDRSADERFRKEFGLLLAAVLFFGILISAAIAVTVARGSLRPLGDMVRAVERTGPLHLSERVASASWPRELQPLALAFDQMLERLEDSFRRLSQFSADLAHELRTPIANMLGESQVALTRARAPEEYRAVIESTAAECERLSAIVENLLFLARAESVDRRIERQRFNGRSAVEKIVGYFQPLAEERCITLQCDGDAEVFAEPMLFERAVGNLIDNALRYTPEGGTVRVSARRRGDGCEVSVSDNGSGIAVRDLPRVWDRFYRADPSRSTPGSGLGLALVKSIAELHGGLAQIRSESGKGTTVTLLFPGEAILASNITNS
jgi:two-component system heavy metal sensor histidine kinase CusS